MSDANKITFRVGKNPVTYEQLDENFNQLAMVINEFNFFKNDDFVKLRDYVNGNNFERIQSTNLTRRIDFDIQEKTSFIAELSSDVTIAFRNRPSDTVCKEISIHFTVKNNATVQWPNYITWDASTSKDLGKTFTTYKLLFIGANTVVGKVFAKD